MLLTAYLKVKGVEAIKDAQPGKPAFRVTLAACEERKVVGSNESEIVSGNAKSFVPLESNHEYLCEVFIGAYSDGKSGKASTYMHIRKIIKQGGK